MNRRTHRRFGGRISWQKCLLGVAAGLFVALSAWPCVFSPGGSGPPAQNDAILPPIGGLGGGFFVARCEQGLLLAGFELRTGDDVDAIRPVCLRAYGPRQTTSRTGTTDAKGPEGLDQAALQLMQAARPWHGGDGGSPRSLLCPSGEPIVTGLFVGAGGQATRVVGTIHLFCGPASPVQNTNGYPAAKFEGRLPAGLYSDSGTQHCPPGLVAVGINGRSGVWLDSVGLICGVPTLAPTSGSTFGQLVGQLGKTKGPPTIQYSDTVTQTSPTAVVGGAAKAPMAAAVSVETLNDLAAKGEAIANADPLTIELRDRQPEGPARRGFDIGLAAAEGQTAPGPAKQRVHDALSPAEQAGFDIAVMFSLERNRNADLAANGAAIAAADPIVAEARMLDADVFYWLGFDIATGIFGDPALGARGNTATGPGSLKIRNSLSAAGQRGFDASVALHLSRNYKP